MPQILHIIIRKTDIEECRVLTTKYQPYPTTKTLYIHTHQKKIKNFVYTYTHIYMGGLKNTNCPDVQLIQAAMGCVGIHVQS